MNLENQKAEAKGNKVVKMFPNNSHKVARIIMECDSAQQAEGVAEAINRDMEKRGVK